MRGFEVSFSAMRYRLKELVCHLLFSATFFSCKVGRQIEIVEMACESYNWHKDAITAIIRKLM